MKLHQSVPTSSCALTLLAIVVTGVAGGVLWPINSFLLKFSVGFVGTVLAILTISGLVWCAMTLYILVFHPLIKLFKFQKKKSLVSAHVTHPDVTPISVERAAREEENATKWIGVAMLTGVAALWLFLVRWAITTPPNSLIVFSGWGAIGCAVTAFGLSVIAGAYDNDDAGTLAVVVVIAGALFTTLVLVGLLALV